jgi:hypothetical protein
MVRRHALPHDKRSPLLQELRSGLIINLAVFAYCAVVVWFGGWRTRYAFGSTLILAGAAIMCVGALSAFAGGASPHEAEWLLGQTPRSDMADVIIRQVLASRRRYYRFAVRMAVTGAAPILVGALIQTYLP